MCPRFNACVEKQSDTKNVVLALILKVFIPKYPGLWAVGQKVLQIDSFSS
jgi:hypothetical protein